MKCPDCNGAKKNMVFVCPPGAWRDMPCSLCDGSGEISETQEQWIGSGKFLRASRLQRNMSLREEADRLGISPYLLSQMERGKIESRPTLHEADELCPYCMASRNPLDATQCHGCGHSL